MREYGMVMLHTRIHGMIKVYRFVICRVMSHNTNRGLDIKGGGRRGTREKMRVIGSMIRVRRLMR